MAPTIVYLHGVGDGDPGKSWLRGLNRSLVQLGHKPVDENDVIAPRYESLLKTTGGTAERKKAPPWTYHPEREREARRKYQIRQARVAKLLGPEADPRVTVGTGSIAKVLNTIKGSGVGLNVITAVSNYLRNPRTQNAVLGHIINQIPQSGEIILIAHSLGTVVAIDLLDQLPEDLHVRRFLTIGSPAGAPALHKHKTEILPSIPYTRVDDWTNLIYPYDPVPTGRGLGAVFAGAQDFRVRWPLPADLSVINHLHGAESYLATPSAGILVADILYPSTALVPSSSDIAVRLDDEEAGVLLVLAYGTRVAEYLRKNDKKPDKDGSRATRYAGQVPSSGVAL